MVKKIKHLEMIQVVIERMARNSFLLKGWSVVLVSAILAIAAGESKSQIVVIAYLPAFVFWCLDGYLLRQKRLFCALYDVVGKKEEDEIDFSMDTSHLNTKVESWCSVTWSVTFLRLFHGSILLAITLIWFVPRSIDFAIKHL
ncbi:MAG: hypothetical protein ABIH66_09240 [bacterium]